MTATRSARAWRPDRRPVTGRDRAWPPAPPGAAADVGLRAGELEEQALEVRRRPRSATRNTPAPASARLSSADRPGSTRTVEPARLGPSSGVTVPAPAAAAQHPGRPSAPRRRRRGSGSRPPRAAASRRGPRGSSRPRPMIPTTSASCWTSDRMWLETNTVLPDAASARSVSRMPDDPGRVEAVGRLVEQQQLRVVEQRAPRCPAAASCPASSPRPCPSRGRRGSTSSSSSSTRAAGHRRPGRRERAQVLAARQERVEGRRLDQRARPRTAACRSPRPNGWPRSSTVPAVRADRARSGCASSWSCRRRWARGTRRRRPSARAGRARRGPPATRTASPGPRSPGPRPISRHPSPPRATARTAPSGCRPRTKR